MITLARLAAVLLLAPAMAPSPARADDLAPRLGVAVRTGAGTCIDVADRDLAVGTTATLVVPERPQRAIQAQVGAPLAGVCKRQGFAAYSVRPRAPVPPDLILVAIIGGAARAPVRGTVPLGVPGDSGFTVRSCTSSEGVHLTAWRGAPLHGPRLWHAYVALGMDVEPTCTEAETNEEASHG